MTAIPMPDHDHIHDHDHDHDHADHDHDHEHEHGDHDHEHSSRTETLQLWIKAALMLGMGVYFIYNIATGNILNYVNSRFAWLSYVAAALFLVIGGFSVWHILRDHDHAHTHDHGDHTHAPISWRVLALLAVPLAIGVLLPSKPLGAEAVSGGVSLSSSATVGTTQTYNANIPPLQRTVLDWLRSFNDADPKTFNGQPADVIGFVYTEPTFDKGIFMVSRFAITCCVADATAIGVPVAWDKSASLPQGQWVEVKGLFNVGSFKGDQVPVLQAASVDQVEQPAHPYLYP